MLLQITSIYKFAGPKKRANIFAKKVELHRQFQIRTESLNMSEHYCWPMALFKVAVKETEHEKQREKRQTLKPIR